MKKLLILTLTVMLFGLMACKKEAKCGTIVEKYMTIQGNSNNFQVLYLVRRQGAFAPASVSAAAYGGYHIGGTICY